jgi:hypothetical protein
VLHFILELAMRSRNHKKVSLSIRSDIVEKFMINDRLNSTPNSDRPSPPTKPERLFLQSNSDLSPPIKLIAYFPIKQRSPLITYKPDRLFPHQTAIA